MSVIAGNSATGEQQMVVSMELNGVQYEGVLFANGSNAAKSVSPSNSSPPSTPSKITTTSTSGTSGGSPLVDERANRAVAVSSVH